MKRNCNLEEKLEAIALVEQGETPRSVANKLHLGHHILYEWLELYRKEGISGLKEKNCEHKKHLSFEEKCEIVREYHERELTLYQLSVKYDVSESSVCTWAKLAQRNGFEALAFHKPRHFQTCGRMVKRLSKEDFEKENERLRKENERLRLENLLLKKVKALVEEREARNRAIGHRPSKS